MDPRRAEAAALRRLPLAGLGALPRRVPATGRRRKTGAPRTRTPVAPLGEGRRGRMASKLETRCISPKARAGRVGLDWARLADGRLAPWDGRGPTGGATPAAVG